MKIFRLLFICSLFSLSTDLLAADSLKYIMHAFMKIKTDQGVVVYIDPALVNAFEDSADIVLITHEHGDHNDLNRVKRKADCVTIRAADALKSGVYQTFNINGITITAVPAYNSNHSKNSCVGYVVEFNGIKIYHPGDTGKITEMADLLSQNINYAFFPMDATYTMTPEQATEAAALIGADHDIPIHTLGGVLGYSDNMVARFTSPNKMVVKPGTTIELTNTPTSVNDKVPAKSFNLYQNYPNPFNPETVISYQVMQPGKVELKIYDLLGCEIATLVNKQQEAGYYSVKFNAGNLPSGIYLYELNSSAGTSSGQLTSVRKMILLR